MRYYKINKRYYNHFNVFRQDKMNNRLKRLLLKNEFKEDEVEKILHKNAENFFKIS